HSRLGVIYGLSGSGKSSLVKAGLIPNLKDIHSIYLESTINNTESDLLVGVRKRCPHLPQNLSLIDAFATLAAGTSGRPGEKLLIVLDQFEQWFLRKRGNEDTELIRALQHCQVQHIQCILIVRDDFLAATIRFMKAVGVEFRPNLNAYEVEP